MGRRSPAVLISGIGAVVGFVLITSVTAALTVPAVAITAQERLPAMLPANTAMYVTADLNPTQSIRDQLSALGPQYPLRMNWLRLLDPVAKGIHADRNHGCLRATGNKAAGNLSDLGHDTAFVLLPAPAQGKHRRLRRTPPLGQAVSANFVVVAPLDVHMTLADALGGVSFSHPNHWIKHRGVEIYREAMPACDQAGGRIPSTYYAAVFKGYIVLGLRIATVEEIIDAGSGHRASLTSVVPAIDSINALPANTIGTFYLNPGILIRSKDLLTSLARERVLPADLISAIKGDGIVAGSAAIQATAVRMTIIHPLAGGPTMPITAPYGNGTPSSGISALFPIGKTSRFVIRPRSLGWAESKIELPGLRHLPSNPTISAATREDSRTSQVTLTIRGSAGAAAGQEYHAVYLGQARTPQQVRDSLNVLRSENALNLPDWPPTADSLSVLRSDGMRTWALIMPSNFSKPGYSAIWYANTDNDKSSIRTLVKLLPFEHDKLVRSALDLGVQSVHDIGGSLRNDPTHGVNIVTLDFGLVASPVPPTPLPPTSTSGRQPTSGPRRPAGPG